ncbi:MAG: lysophospholipid acyltransferase family protein [Myxococcota bacterium]
MLVAPSRIADRLAAPPVRATAEELRALGAFERFAFRTCDLVNSRPGAKRVAQWFLHHVGMAWVCASTRRLVRLDGESVLRALDPTKGLLLCANHRSFFDLYVVSSWIGETLGRLPNLYFPVRANFFYENPLGLLVNLAMSAFAMYPPVFRDARKKDFNAYALARIVELARTPGALVGFHPEGTRGKGPDPYTLLPAQPGVGQVIYEARPLVLPVFVNGLGNGIARQFVDNLTGRGEPVWVVFGQPLELTRFYALPNRLRTHKTIADHVLAEIAKLGERERALRSGATPAQPSQSRDESA